MHARMHAGMHARTHLRTQLEMGAVLGRGGKGGCIPDHVAAAKWSAYTHTLAHRRPPAWASSARTKAPIHARMCEHIVATGSQQPRRMSTALHASALQYALHAYARPRMHARQVQAQKAGKVTAPVIANYAKAAELGVPSITVFVRV